MIPDFNADGRLPPGIHWATWGEVQTRFASTGRRRALLRGLKNALVNLKRAGVQTVYLDGSFVTVKTTPGDFDACWDPAGADGALIDPVLLDFTNKRAAQKAKYSGELFPADTVADTAGSTFLAFFQRDKDTGTPKGIIGIDLRSLP
jgi:hypothetical protein